MSKRSKLQESLVFLQPLRLIKERKFTKKDVANIKNSLLTTYSTLQFIIAIVIIVLITTLSIIMHIATEGHFVEYYGFAGLLAQIIIVSGALICIALIIIGRLLNNGKSYVLYRIGMDILYLGAVVYILLCVLADAQMGFTTHNEALSGSIIFVAILLLIQPVRWTDAFILDMGTGIGIVVMALVCSSLYDMKSVLYYIFIGIIYPLMCYLVVSILFYAESQHYREQLENERLTNRAYYDNLTKCKNRHALSEFLIENKSRWNKTDANLLMVLFDIDDFKLYNDQFSHLGGDYCLKTIADAIRSEFPSPSLDFFRYGGEEFLLFFELEDKKSAPQVMEKIKHAISNLDIVAPKGAPKKMVTISLGGLLIKNAGDFSFEEEMKIVDAYLYKAKSNGKDAACYNGSIIK